MRLLTTNKAIINIDPHSKKTSAGRGNPKDTGQRAAIKAVFYCLPKTKNTGLIRVSMLWRADPGSVRRWPVPVSGFSTLFQSVAHSVERRSGGLSSNTGETAMVNHTQQNPPVIQGKFNPRFDLIKLTNGVKTLICRDINLEQAKGLLSESSAYRLKFTGAVKGGAA